jgi:hypothetical protein
LKVIAVRGVDGHLQHQLFIAAVLLDEKCIARGATPHAPDDSEAAFQVITRHRAARVCVLPRIGCGQFVLDLVELTEEVLDRFEAAEHIGVRRTLHELVQALAAAIEHIRKA